MMAFSTEDLQIVEKIGAGSYSTVYKTRRKNWNPEEFVAIKVVDILKLSKRGKDDIVTEIQMMKMLKHENIVEMLDFKFDKRSIFIIMEYCDGGDLSSFIRQRCRLEETVCQKFLQQLAVGLQFLRSHDISHLDLKPQNLLIVTTPKITLKIGDFGFAQFLSETTQESSIRGSPLYMAPEMLLGGKYDARADLWSVGVITYECLFGKAPYSSGTYQELYNKIRSKAAIEFPSDVNLSEECRTFLSSLLVHDPDKRMNYDAFFNHDFLALEFVPSSDNYKKALTLFAEAEHLDSTDEHIEAFNKYCQGLRYLFPILQDEINADKKVILREKVIRYTKRAEELKSILVIDDANQKENSGSVSTSSSNPNSFSRSTRVGFNCDTKKFKPPLNLEEDHVPLKQLVLLCSNTPSLLTGLEIGISAQMYLAEGKYELALEKFKSSLGLLLSQLPWEPTSIRRDLLHSQIRAWMQQAESTQSLLLIKKNNESLSAISPTKESCSIQ